MTSIPFTKMNGLGNDFIIIDRRSVPFDPRAHDLVRLADRRFGIGCDQIILMEPSSKANIFMRIYNADGSEVSACGNATRCIAWLIAQETGKALVTIETAAGPLQAHVASEREIQIDMGMPRMEWREIPLCEERDTLHLGIEEGPLRDPVGVSMGNPHAVFFVENVDSVNLGELGPKLEHHPLFPERANIGVAQISSGTSLRLRVWERGVGETLACGTGACAAAVAAIRRGLAARHHPVSVELPGGILLIEWREEDGHVLMTGAVETNFTGSFNAAEYAL